MDQKCGSRQSLPQDQKNGASRALLEIAGNRVFGLTRPYLVQDQKNVFLGPPTRA